jgi:ankyrin repeat protein
MVRIEQAAATGDLAEVQRLWMANERDNNDMDGSALHQAAKNGHLAVVEYLVAEEGVPVTSLKKNSQAMPMHMAAMSGHAEVSLR